jgi:hypothetical protein
MNAAGSLAGLPLRRIAHGVPVIEFIVVINSNDGLGRAAMIDDRGTHVLADKEDNRPRPGQDRQKSPVR